MAHFLRPLPFLVVGVLFLSGCVAHGAGVIGRSHTPSSRQIDRDVRAYVQHLDRYLNLDRRQRRSIEARLADRTVHLMRNTKVQHRNRVYPFPREYDRYSDRSVRRWWTNADRDIERVLTRRQLGEFRDLRRGRVHPRNNRDRSNNRGRGNRRSPNRYLDDAQQLNIPPRGATMDAPSS